MKMVTKHARCMLIKKYGGNIQRAYNELHHGTTEIVINALMHHIEIELGLGRKVLLPKSWKVTSHTSGWGGTVRCRMSPLPA